MPEVGDDALVCDKCGRQIPLDEIEPWRIKRILDSVRRNEGKVKAGRFQSALEEAMRGKD